MTDTITLQQLRVDALIGVYDWEQTEKQTLLLDVEIETDAKRGAKTDKIADALDYSALAHRLIEFIGSTRFQLIETLAERTAELILAEFPTNRVRLTLHKPQAVPEAQNVALRIERHRT